MKKSSIKDFSLQRFIQHSHFIDDFFCYFILFFLSLIIMWHLLSPGYIFTLDHVTYENGKYIFLDYLRGFREDYNGVFLTPLAIPNFIYLFLMFIMGSLFSVELFQKIFFLFLIFGSGASAYYACPSDKYGKLFAGVLYMINPFTYVRYLAGHTMLLLSYVFLPLFFKSLIDFAKKDLSNEKNKITSKFKIISKSRKDSRLKLFCYSFSIDNFYRVFSCNNLSFINSKKLYEDSKYVAKISILMTLCIATSHYLPLVLLSLFLFMLIDFKKFKYYLLTFLLFFLMNFYWIIPIFGETSPHEKIEQISELDLLLFSSKPSLEFNTLFNVASLHGFWRGGYDYAKYHISFWPILYFVILYFSVYGFMISKEKGKMILLLISVLSLIFAAGIGFAPIREFIIFAYEKISILKGLREPHKLLAMLCLFYAYFGGVGVGSFISSIKKISVRKSKFLLRVPFLLFILVPIIYSYTMLFGFNGWLKTANYPNGWNEVNKMLNSDADDFNVLFFPWHLYMDFSWIPNNDKRIANPSYAFFEKPIISAENIETFGIGSQTTKPSLLFVEFLLSKENSLQNFGELVSLINVKYILLAKEADWQKYLWLKEQKDLELVEENDNFLVFKNKKYNGRLYLANKVARIKNYEELFALSENDEINKIAFLDLQSLDYEENTSEICKNLSLEYSKISPIEYEIVIKNSFLENSSYKNSQESSEPIEKSQRNDEKCYLIFNSKFSKNWELLLDGYKIAPKSGFAFSNVFEINASILSSKNETKGKIKMSICYFLAYQCYWISLGIFALLLFFVLKRGKK